MTFADKFSELKKEMDCAEAPYEPIPRSEMEELIEKCCCSKNNVSNALKFWFNEDRTTVKTIKERLTKVFEELGLNTE